jgi:acetoin:2,6-dichlorophenolindophenol oxidoreductase subunit beta
MSYISFREALNKALEEEMINDDKVVLIGEDIAEQGGAFQVTKGLLNKFGHKRVKNTPISEVAIIGAAIGAAAVGLRPVAEIMFDDFILVAADQIINQMAKIRYMTGGQLKIPVTVRMPMGAGLSQAAQHAQCLVGMFLNIPGLKIICPSNPYDAKGILKSAIKDDNPVLFFEHINLYDIKGTVPDEEYYLEIGKADIKRTGKDLTIIAISEMVNKSLNVAKKMESFGIDTEVIDPISLSPLDHKTIISSVKKTGRAIVVYNGPVSNGSGTEILAIINELAFEYLKCPIYRIAEKNCPLPFSPVLESFILPQEEDIESTIRKIFKK